MRSLQERVLETVRKRELITPGDRVAVAVSGGADSVALLRILLDLRSDLGIVLSLAHVNYQLRGAESDDDHRFVAGLARDYELELHARVAPVHDSGGTGVEAAARKLRYEFFRELAHTGRISKVATAHTLDDQAETVLLRIFRGTGIRGLAGILPRLALKHDGHPCGEVVRPLLALRREELRQFLHAQRQSWREDSSNESTAFLRNKLRQNVLPPLRAAFGESALENLADLAEIARAEEEASAQSAVPSSRNSSLDLHRLLSLPLAGRRRMVRNWMDATAPGVSISFRAIEDVLELAEGEPGRKLELPGGRTVCNAQGKLAWEDARESTEYEYMLPIPGCIQIRELGIRIEAVLVQREHVPEPERECLLDPGKLRAELRIRNWRPGDRYWPPNRKQAKKVKELLTERHAAGVEKKLWPVVEAGGELVWLRGFGAPTALRPAEGALAVWLREFSR